MGLLRFFPMRVGLPVLFSFSVALFSASCASSPKDRKSILSTEQDIPCRLAVLPARLMPPRTDDTGLEVQKGSENAEFLTALVRGVTQNQLAGKGFVPVLTALVDRKLKTLKGKDEWTAQPPKALCRLLGADGVVYIDILSATILKALAYDQYSILARVKIFGKSGDIIGEVTESASKRKLSIPTTPIGGALTLLQIVLDEPARKHMRMVVYDWGWKMAQLLPDNLKGEAFPEIMFVQSNIDKGTFALGDTIEVTINAEKNLTGTMDLGEFKKGIPLSSHGGGTYRGTYAVRKGDHASGQPMEIHMIKSNGVERIWVETGGTVTIDAVPPPPPESVKAQTGITGISLSWPLPSGEDLHAFVVERSETPVGGFVKTAETPELTYSDSRVSQGKTYYYRVRAMDRLGNRSLPSETVSVTLPYFQEKTLSGTMKGAIVPGNYRVEKTLTVGPGATFQMGPGVNLKFNAGAGLVVQGNLKVAGTADNPAILEGEGWKGIHVDNGGSAEISHARFRGCSACLENSAGRLTLTDSALDGNGIGLNLEQNAFFTVKNTTITGFHTGVRVDRGEGLIQGCTISGNDLGLDYVEGALRLMDNNLHENHESDVTARTTLFLEANYLGAAQGKAGGLKGEVIFKEVLDAPYPHGRKVAVALDGPEPEKARATAADRFEAHKTAGMAAFEKRDYEAAAKSLALALALRPDKESYLCLAFSQTVTGQTQAAGNTLERGIEAFPEDTRFYPIYVKHLVAHGETEKAMVYVEKGLVLSPNDENLKFLKTYLQNRD